MVSFEYRILSEFKVKKAKIDTLSSYILNHKDQKGIEAKEASEFLDVLIDEMDKFYVLNGEILSKNGTKPHHRSHLPDNKKWNENVEIFYEKNPRRRPRK